MKNSANKRRIRNIAAACIAAGAILFSCFMFFPGLARGYWGGGGGGSGNQDSDGNFGIGRWDDIGGDPIDKSLLADAVTDIESRDLLIQTGARNLINLGTDDGTRTLTAPVYSNGDVLVWQTEEGAVIAAQVTNAVTLAALNPSAFSSWENLLAAAVNAQSGALKTTGLNVMGAPRYTIGSSYSQFKSGSVYSSMNAPVNSGGKQYLATGRGITSAPSASSPDWFRYDRTGAYISGQHYPTGSIVTYNSAHYVKLSDTDATPGSNVNIWRPFEDEPVQDIPEWALGVLYEEGDVVQDGAGELFGCVATNFVPTGGYTGDPASDANPLWIFNGWVASAPAWNVTATYNEGDIVSYNGQFYRARIDITPRNLPLNIPGAWETFSLYDAANTVPEFVLGSTYEAGSLVKTTQTGAGGKAEVRYWRKQAIGNDVTPASNAASWLAVEDWNRIAGVQKFDNTNAYPTGTYEGALVESDGQIFRRAGGYIGGGDVVYPTPQEDIQASQNMQRWEKIYLYSETLKPIEFVPGGDYSTVGLVLKYNNNGNIEYYGTFRDGLSGFQTPNLDWTARRILPWNSSTTYTDFSNYGGTYFCSTGDDPDNLEFWRLNVGITNIAGGGEPSVGNPNWQQIVFNCKENMVVTKQTVAGETVFTPWVRSSATDNPGKPGETGDWVKYVVPVRAAYVYTAHEGAVTLWQNMTGGNATGEPGKASGATDWGRAEFRTGKHFVYTQAGSLKTFYYSPTQSSFLPKVVNDNSWADWEYVAMPPPLPDYYYTSDGSTTRYFKSVGDTPFELKPAWIGGGSTVISHWVQGNPYSAGYLDAGGVFRADIVVSGVNAANEYRYFRLKAGANPVAAAASDPVSSRGGECWEPIDIDDPYW